MKREETALHMKNWKGNFQDIHIDFEKKSQSISSNFIPSFLKTFD